MCFPTGPPHVFAGDVFGGSTSTTEDIQNLWLDYVAARDFVWPEPTVIVGPESSGP